MTNYFDHPAMSQSKLKDLKKSPKHFWTKHLSSARMIESPSEAMQFGTAVHTCLFEHAAFMKNYIILPKFDKRTKDGKVAYNEFIDNNINKTFIEEDDYIAVNQIRVAILNKKTSSILFGKNGILEQELYWIDEDTGIECKAKADYFIEPCAEFPNGILIDLKTTINARPDEFTKSIYNYGYYNQMAWYCNGVKQLYKTQDYPMFIFIPVEKVAPYECSFLMGDNDMLEAGLRENKKLLALYKQCMETKNWYGYEDKIQSIALPAWAANKLFFEELA